MNDTPEMSRADGEAAFWLFRHDLGLSPEEEVQFAAWLAASAEHGTAWARNTAAIDAIGFEDDPFLEAMRTDALAARPRPSFAKRVTRIAAISAAALFVGTVSLVGWQAMRPHGTVGSPPPSIVAANTSPAFQTGDAARIVTLPDGSQVTLDRQTALAVSFSDRRRDIHVLRGEALFDVRHDGRTFAVTGADTTVTATGTRFAVQLLAGSVVATLERGGVVVGRTGDQATVTLAPGEQVTSIAGRPMTVAKVDPAVALRWSVTYVTFNDTPLAQAVAQMSPRSTKPIRVIGSAAQLKVSGRFRADDPQGFLMAVTQALGVRQRVAKDGAIELVPRR